MILGRRHVLASPSHRLLLHLLVLAALTIGSLASWYRIVSPPELHWDFRLDYWAARTLAEGRNPYAADEVYSVMAAHGFSQLPLAVNERHLYGFLGYPPFVLRALRALTSDDYAASRDGYLWAKFAGCGILVLIWFVMLPHWRRLSLPELALFWIAIWVALFAAWNRPLYVDLAAGNVTVFEQLLVWLGLLAFARGRPVLFAFGIGVAASMRLMPLALLVLLVFTWRRSPRSALIAGGTALVVFLLPHLASLVFDRSEYLGYLGVVGRMSEEARGETNPSSYALLRDVVEHASRQAMTGGWLALHARAVAFLLWLALASGGLCFYLISSWKLHLDRRPLLLLSYTCFCLACLLPRFKMYSYLLVVAPTVYTLQALPVAARALLLAAAVWGLPFTGFFQSGYLAYFPLWLFAATLFLICGPLARRQKNAGFFADAAL